MVSLKNCFTDMVAVGTFRAENHAKVYEPEFYKTSVYENTSLMEY
jgi:hypothetical protein